MKTPYHYDQLTHTEQALARTILYLMCDVHPLPVDNARDMLASHNIYVLDESMVFNCMVALVADGMVDIVDNTYTLPSRYNGILARDFIKLVFNHPTHNLS